MKCISFLESLNNNFNLSGYGFSFIFQFLTVENKNKKLSTESITIFLNYFDNAKSNTATQQPSNSVANSNTGSGSDDHRAQPQSIQT